MTTFFDETHFATSIMPSLSRTVRACLRLHVGMKYYVDGQPYVFDRYLEEGQLAFKCVRNQLLLRQDPLDPRSPLPDSAWVNEMLAAGRFGTRSVRKDAPTKSRRLMNEAEAREADPASVIRYNILVEVDRHGPHPDNVTLGQVAQSVFSRYPVEAQLFEETLAIRTIRDWLRNRGAYLDRAWADCVSLAGRARPVRLPEPLRKLVIDAVLTYWADVVMSPRQAFSRLEGSVLAWNISAEADGKSDRLDLPAYSTFLRYIDHLATSDTVRGKFGETSAKKMQAVGKIQPASRILETVQGDHTPVDVMVCDDVTGAVIGRPTLTTIIDVKSRCILGYYLSFDPAGFGPFLQCFKRCLTPKINCAGAIEFPILQDIFGLPSVIVLDNAMEFVGVNTQDAMTDFGVVLTFPPVKAPEAKPFVERLFGTLNSMGLHSLQGTTLNQSKKLKRNGDYKPEAALTLNGLHELIDHVIYAYHISPHEGLNKRPPAQVWQDDAVRHGIPVLYDLERVDALIAASERRVLCRDGIQLAGLMYNHGPTTNLTLAEFTAANFDRREKLKIKYNPLDLSCIWFFHPLKNEYLRLPSVDPDYTSGLSLYQHRQILAHLAATGLEFSSRDQRLKARQALQAKIYQITPGLLHKQRKAAARLAARPKTTEKLEALGLTSATGIPLLPHVPLQARTTDGGALPKGALRGAAKARATRQKNADLRRQYEAHEAAFDNQDDEDVFDDFDDADWKGYDYE